MWSTRQLQPVVDPHHTLQPFDEPQRQLHVSTTRTAQDPAASLLDAATGAAVLVVGISGSSPVTVLVVNPDTVRPDPGEPSPPGSHSAKLDHPHDHSLLF